MTPKKLLLPPLIPVVLLLLLCAWIVFSETTGETRLIDGSPDNAPTRAALILAMLSPLAYIFFAVFNLLDTILDRLNPTARWIGTGILIFAFVALLSMPFYSPDVDTSPLIGISIAFGVSIVAIAPMSVFRRLVIKTRTQKKHNKSEMATPRKPSD